MLLFAFTLGLAGQNLLNRAVSISLENATLEEALYQLIDRHDLPLSFSNDILPSARVSIHLQGVALKHALNELLRGSSLRFEEVGQQIVIYLPADAVFTLSGFLEDSRTGERLANASIAELLNGKGTVSNRYGFYSLTLPAGKARLSFTYLGYEPRTLDIMLHESQQLNLALRGSLDLAPVEVVGQRIAPLPKKLGPGLGHDLQVEEAERLPTLGGEADVLRMIHLLPGVQTGAEGIGGLHIRGGDNGQNLIMIDGVPVYNAAHGAGLLSVFNSHAIQSARLIKGAFPARYGGRLASVLDIRTREGNRKEFSARGEVGMLAGKLFVEGPLVPEKGSFFLSARRSLVDWYLQPLSRSIKAQRGEDGVVGYRFYDLNGKANLELSSRSHLYLSLYSGGDRYSNTSILADSMRQDLQGFRYDRFAQDQMSWGNTVASLRWNYLFNDKFFGNFALTYSALDSRINHFQADSVVNLATGLPINHSASLGYFASGIQDVGAQIDLDYIPSPRHYLRFGLHVLRHRFDNALLVGDQEKTGNDPARPLPGFPDLARQSIAWESAAYIEDEVKLGQRLAVNAGLHAAAFHLRGQSYWSLQPRLAASWQVARALSFEGYYNQMQQFVHLLTNSAIGLPTELWVPSTEEVGPQASWQAGLAAQQALGRGWGLSLDGYYKAMRGLPDYIEGAPFLDDWAGNVTIGEGRAYGAELLLRKSQGKLRAWAAYGLAWADRQYEDINNGLRFPYRFDRRHEFKTAVIFQLQDWMDFSANWLYSTGLAFSPPVGQYEIFIPGAGWVTAIDFGQKNAYRMPAYHRLDVGANFRLHTGAIQHVIHIGVYNLYNRRNPLYYDLRTTYRLENGQLRPRREFVQSWLLPMLPSLSYSAQF
jgi:hypothetical protein